MPRGVPEQLGARPDRGQAGVPGQVDRDLFERRELDDGTAQLAVAGQPIYRFAGDLESGDMNGQGVDSLWFMVAPDGTRNTSTVPTAAV